MGKVRRTLLSILRDPTTCPELAGFDTDDFDRLWDLAAWHRVSTALGIAADRLPPTMTERVVKERFRAAQIQFSSVGDLARLREAFAGAGIDWATFKGPTLARLPYGGHLVRAYADVDVLVHPAQLEQAVTSLLQIGSRELDVNWPMMSQLRLGQLSLVLPHGTSLDLHWDLLHDDAEREAFDFDAGAVLDSAVDVRIGQNTLRTFEPHDHLLFVASHAVLAGGARLLWLKDVERLATCTAINATTLWDKARQAGLELPLAIVGGRLSRLLGSEVLRPRGRPGRSWRAMIAGFDALRPPGSLPPGVLSGTGLVRSTRRTSMTSFARLGGEVRRFVTDDLLANPNHPWRRHPCDVGPEPINPLHVEVDDPTARQAFYESVKAWSR